MSNTANWPLAMSGTKAYQTISGLVQTHGHLIMLRHAIGWNLRVCLLWLTGVESSIIERPDRQTESAVSLVWRQISQLLTLTTVHNYREARQTDRECFVSLVRQQTSQLLSLTIVYNRRGTTRVDREDSTYKSLVRMPRDVIYCQSLTS